MRLKNSRFETFNDGVLDICEASKRVLTKTKVSGARFGNKTVGYKRYWDVKVAGTEISRMVSVLYLPQIERDDIALIGDRQYRIADITEKFDASPPCLYLTLESVQPPYKDERSDIP